MRLIGNYHKRCRLIPSQLASRPQPKHDTWAVGTEQPESFTGKGLPRLLILCCLKYYAGIDGGKVEKVVVHPLRDDFKASGAIGKVDNAGTV